MTAKIIKDTIYKDRGAPTRTALDVFNKCPNQWPAAIDVPPAYFTPLKDLILPPGATDQKYWNILIETYGIGATPSDNGIHIVTLPSESVTKSDSSQSSSTGAEYALLKIFCVLGATLTDAQKDLAEQLDLRVRLLLDYNCRSRRHKNGEVVIPKLDPSIDPTVDKKFPVLCHWLGFLDNESSIGKASLYKLEYTRLIA